MKHKVQSLANAILKPQMGLKKGRQIVYDSSEEEEDNNSKRAKHAGDNYKLFYINIVL